ncbi:MAG: hypothetical protein DI629_03625 [Mesorhizobium amorphae]|nr:MAG: hypothetical protein DI629_03625 [Mesorhizobium amorphae]
MTKIALSTQINDARDELRQRKVCDASGVARTKPSRSEGTRRAEIQEAILETLIWASNNREEFDRWRAERAAGAQSEGAKNV